MITRLRTKLAVWFVFLVMLLYAAGGLASLMVFRTGVMRSVDLSLTDLIAELTPAIQFVDEKPSLHIWGETAKREKLHHLTTVQIYDSNQQFLERYGPDGISGLHNGSLISALKGQRLSVRSMYKEIKHDGKFVGYIQIQVPTKVQDSAIKHLVLSLLIIAPLLAVGVGICAFFFSDKATRPIDRTMLMLRRFVAAAGHELNTPVATIEAALQTLREPSKGEDIKDDVLEMIERASSRLKTLSTNLVLLAKIEDPLTDIPKELLSLRNILETIIPEFRRIAEKKNIRLSTGEFADVTIEANAELIEEVLSNLIDNAIKYTEENGSVTISAASNGKEVEISVADTGIGISEESQSNVFDQFYRVDKSRSRIAGGSGLGLSIVKSATESHGGHVSLSSKLGSGSTFTVIFPIV